LSYIYLCKGVLIGVPSDDLLGEGKDSDRVKYRRNKIIEIVDKHVERMAEKTDSVAIESIQYAFVTSLEYGFTQFFPRHTKEGASAAGLDEPLPTPAIRLTNVDSGEKMQPDWPILLADLPDELDRLVTDYERWQTLTKDVTKDENGVVRLHSKNLVPALNQYQHVVTMFYAPWCHYSQMMLPKYAEASSIISKAIEDGLIDKRRVIMGQVNVDEEGELKMDYNISSYPTLKTISGSNKKAARRDRATWKDEKLFPHAPFSGDMGSSADLASHILTVNAWPKRLNYANLISNKEKEEENALTDLSTKSNLSTSIQTFVDIVKIADGALKAAGEKRSEKIEQEEDDQIAAFEAKRSVVILVVFPEEEEEGKQHTIPERSKLTHYIARDFAGINKFVASISSKDVVTLLSQLPGEEFEVAKIEDQLSQYKKKSAASNNNNNGYIVIAKCEFSSLLFHEIPSEILAVASNERGESKEEEEEDKKQVQVQLSDEFGTWMTAATWPTIARFDPSAAQGQRIQTGPVKNLCILVGNEKDFMFEEFKSSLEEVSNKYVGFAHYLYADQSEVRLSGLLRSVNVEVVTEPIVILVSMKNEFKPSKISGSKIDAESISSLIDRAQESSINSRDEF
jgi:thiol-disulfide isomerase/thioredoxin